MCMYVFSFLSCFDLLYMTELNQFDYVVFDAYRHECTTFSYKIIKYRMLLAICEILNIFYISVKF